MKYSLFVYSFYNISASNTIWTFIVLSFFSLGFIACLHYLPMLSTNWSKQTWWLYLLLTDLWIAQKHFKIPFPFKSFKPYFISFWWYVVFLCPHHSKNGGGVLSVTPVRPFVRPCVRASVTKFVVRSITFERLHGFNSNLVCLYIISKHRSSSIWVTIH